MRKLIAILAIVALLSVTAFALHTYKTPLQSSRIYGTGGVQRVTHYDPRVNYQTVNTQVAMTPPGPVNYPGAGRGGYNTQYPRGTANIKSITWYGYPRGRVQIKTKDLRASDQDHNQYEAWLVDQETGYRLSVGVFTTSFGGVGLLDYHIDKYFDPYDFVEITVEPLEDLDVSPGPVVLLGKIPEARYFNPPPKGAKMVTESIKTY